LSSLSKNAIANIEKARKGDDIEILKGAYIFVVPDVNSRKHKTTIETPSLSMTIVGVKDYDISSFRVAISSPPSFWLSRALLSNLWQSMSAFAFQAFDQSQDFQLFLLKLVLSFSSVVIVSVYGQGGY
jgi:hypothetical protein